jgi:RNA methyltransferase, TrmH family
MAAPEAGRRLDCTMDEVETVGHGGVQVASVRQTGGDRGRESTPGAVGRAAHQPWAVEHPDVPGSHQDIGHHFAGQVPALEQDRLCAQGEQLFPGEFHRGRVPRSGAGEDGGLVEIRGHQGRQREEPIPNDAFGLGIEQTVPGRGDHDRIAHVVPPPELGERIGQDGNQLRRGEHAGLEGIGWQILGEGLELGPQDGSRGGVDRPHSQRVLRGERRDGAGAEHPELMERLEVGLDTGAATRVGARNGKRDFHRRSNMTKAFISTIRDLHRKKARERRGLALAEGVRLLEEALAAGITIKGAAVSPALQATPRGRGLEAALAARGVPLESMEDDALSGLADTEQPQGIVAVVEVPTWTLAQLRPGPGSVILVLDAVQDPGNVGALARAAYALGAAGMVALEGTADLSNSKALRGSMGALFRLPTVATDDAEFLAWLRATASTLLVADARGTDVRRFPRDPKAALSLAVGNEGAGVRPALLEQAAGRIAIPLRQGVESLNVAVAAGILLYEVTRER